MGALFHLHLHMAASDRMYLYIDDAGVPVLTDQRSDPRAVRYRPGDFARIALRQQGIPHVGQVGAPDRVSLRYQDLVADASRRHRVPVSLLNAVIAVESGFDPAAVSRAGARGLMQLMPATARDLGVDDPHDPVACIDGGTRYLGFLLRHFDDEELALAAYNAGPGRVVRAGGIPKIPETEAYVQRVQRLAQLYAAETLQNHGRTR